MAGEDIEKGDKGILDFQLRSPLRAPARFFKFTECFVQLLHPLLCAWLNANISHLVSWNWGAGQPGGEVVEKKEEGEIAIKSKKGNTIKKNADPDNPAVHIGRSGNDVVKRASELIVDEKKSGGNKSDDKEEKTNGKKHEREEDEEAKEEEKEEEPEEKKQKKSGGRPKKADTSDAKKKDAAKDDANADKKRGRPKKEGGATSAPRKKKDAKPRATEGIGSRTRSRA